MAPDRDGRPETLLRRRRILAGTAHCERYAISAARLFQHADSKRGPVPVHPAAACRRAHGPPGNGAGLSRAAAPGGTLAGRFRGGEERRETIERLVVAPLPRPPELPGDGGGGAWLSGRVRSGCRLPCSSIRWRHLQ